jgi:hypothetical protein
MARPRDDLLQAPGWWPEQRPQRGDPKLAPVDRLERFPGRLAQLGERRLDKAEVTGSSPVSPIVGFGSGARELRPSSRGLVASW